MILTSSTSNKSLSTRKFKSRRLVSKPWMRFRLQLVARCLLRIPSMVERSQIFLTCWGTSTSKWKSSTNLNKQFKGHPYLRESRFLTAAQSNNDNNCLSNLNYLNYLKEAEFRTLPSSML